MEQEVNTDFPICSEAPATPAIGMLLTEQLNQITVFNEVVQEDSLANTNANTGIEASDIGSLYEQFLEYEQGSDADVSSPYPDSSIWTPCASPGEPNEDAVLGRLMIVQEKLSREVEDKTPPRTPPTTDAEIETYDNNNSTKRKSDGLLRTINGIHPKGENVRMADSPKFAKFKKKRLTMEPPLRRCYSGSTTPRCTSPSDIVSPEEMKRREAKLIEALALTTPKQNANLSKEGSSKRDIEKAKRNLIKSPTRKRKQPISEPLASRMMPVISKRHKNLEQNNAKDPPSTIDPRMIKKSDSADPRLNKANYGQWSNVTQLKNTKLVELNSSINTATETIDDISIIDMTIDHDLLPEPVIASTAEHSSSTESNVTVNACNSVKEEVVSSEVLKENIAENVDFSENKELTVNDTNVVKSDTVQTTTAPNGKSLSENGAKKVVKPPKNYRKVNNMTDKTESSSSGTEDDDGRTYKRKKYTQQSPHSRRSMSHSRSRSGSHSPHCHSRSVSHNSRSPSRYRSRSPYQSRKSSYRSRSRSHASSTSRHNSDDENVDISSKLSELSNPVPYDIEHERKVRFLSGQASKGNNERRNIYAGGITRRTTKAELAERFKRFGNIDKITLHFREKGDNYAFIVFENPESAMRAIEEGNDDSDYSRLELCFGGRRKFVGGSYVDFDGNNSYLEESDMAPRNTRCESPKSDFDRLLQMAMKDSKKKETTPEWT